MKTASTFVEAVSFSTTESFCVRRKIGLTYTSLQACHGAQALNAIFGWRMCGEDDAFGHFVVAQGIDDKEMHGRAVDPRQGIDEQRLLNFGKRTGKSKRIAS